MDRVSPSKLQATPSPHEPLVAAASALSAGIKPAIATNATAIAKTGRSLA
jgi:hypothetical protein